MNTIASSMRPQTDTHEAAAPAPDAARQPKKWSFADLHGSSTAWIILAASIVITVTAWYIASRSMESAVTTRFAYKAEDVSAAIENRMGEQEAALWGGVGIFNASEDLTREEWAKYVASLRLETFLPGLQGYGYAEFVRDADKAAHEARVRAEGFSNFTVRPAGTRPLYASIIYLEPFRDRNLRAFGYDMFSEPTRRAALERARDTGDAAVSGRVTLVQETETDVQPGFLMYLPVYKKGMPTATVEERRAAIQGTVYSPFRMKDLMGGILGKEDDEIDFKIYDGLDKQPENLLYDSATERVAADEESRFKATKTVDIGGRPWTLEFSSRPGFVSGSERAKPMIIAAGGVLIDILLFLTITALTNQRRHAVQMANEMTVELRGAMERAENAAASELELRTETERANGRLKEANEGLLRFSSIVAHDLRAPLKRIESFVEILRDEYAGALDLEGRDILARIKRGSVRMRLMLDSLHEYAKFSRITVNSDAANLTCIVDHAVDCLAGEMGDARVQMRLHPQQHIRGDAVLLQHVIQNLVSNSVKFRGKSRPFITIASRPLADGRLEVAVADDGIGIDPQFADGVFNMFARLHDEDEFEGCGIGLAVCKKIVEDHGGEIFVDTRRSKGTRIVLRLPMADIDTQCAPDRAETDPRCADCGVGPSYHDGFAGTVIDDRSKPKRLDRA